MNQNVFETRQRASELLEEAIKIWKKSEQSEYLEGLDTDPVFRLLLNALAYQANELQSDIQVLKEEILEEFDSVLARGEACKAIPAVVVVSAPPASEISETVVNSYDEFFLVGDSGIKFPFTPLFKTKVINANVSKVSRIDARRWAVSFSFPKSIRNLSGFSFAFPFHSISGLRVFITETGEEVPLLQHSDFASFPMSDFFSLETILYNKAQAVNTGGVRSGMTPYSSVIAMDLFARSNVSCFIFGDMEDFSPVTELNLIFEFSGINLDFSLTYDQLKLNALVLVNARHSSVTISPENPIVKLNGAANDEQSKVQFLHLLPPAEDSFLSEVPVQIRRINMERFNEGRLLRLLQNLIIKYNSDYYAFTSIGTKSSDPIIRQLQKNLSELIHVSKSKLSSVVPGTYAYLDIHKSESNFSSRKNQENSTSVRVDYLITDGAEVNKNLRPNAKFSGPQWLDEANVTTIVEPSPGMNEILNKREEKAVSKYYISTADRIVTPYDVKIFCYTELMTRFGIEKEMIERILVQRKETMAGGYRAYEGVVTITLKANEFVERAFSGKTDSIQAYLSRMILSRTNGMYPLSVRLVIDKQAN